MYSVPDVHHDFAQCDKLLGTNCFLSREFELIIFPAPRRCSGYSRGEECKFSLLLDVGESEVWGGGLVTISHTCVNTGNIITECGDTDTQVTGGPVSN